MTQLLQKARNGNVKPTWIGDTAWTDLVKYWKYDDFKAKSEQNKKNCNSSAGASLHTGGSIPHKVHFKRMKAERNGKDPTFSEFYFCTHKKKKKKKKKKSKEWVHPKAQSDHESFEKKKVEMSSQRTIESESFSGDDASQSHHMPSDFIIWIDTVRGQNNSRV
ncbi:unnamed protein product [Cuscuta europaea]|uniref:Uncharacterized protein n=1 Tax=Cuscuta europaea TaxID=41803 RepID=A0A9P0YYL7_CUSEU|nr:unnamed protein product [Cuscuta europaea]